VFFRDENLVYDGSMQIAGILTIIIGIQLLITHVIALELYLYGMFWWMDIVMHFLGGIWLMCAWRALVDMRILSARAWSLSIIMPVLVSVMVAWEVFGVYVEQGFKAGYMSDTSGDMLCGIVGALVGFWLLRRLQILNTTES